MNSLLENCPHKYITNLSNPFFIIMRGLPGSGKSTLALKLSEQFAAVIVSTDHRFIQPDGSYKFEASKVEAAHQQTREMAFGYFKEKKTVILDNCNIHNYDIAPYLKRLANWATIS